MRTGTDEYGHHIGNSMAGTLPTQLSGAAGLAQLFFYDSRISGTMPTELMELTRLEELELSNSPHVEGLPGHFSAAPLPMSGTVPTQIAALEGLGVLILQYSSLSGTLPLELQNLTSLSLVYCHDNSVSGTVPPQLAGLGELSTLVLGVNSLSGTVPTQLGEIKTLGVLYLGTTSLSGTIPPQLTKLSKLNALILGTTSLSGTISPHLAKRTELTNLDLGHTSLSGTLPSSVGALPALTALDLYDMRLSGIVPTSVLRRCLPFCPVECDGLPPFSCSAFGLDRSRLSLTSVGACVNCPSRTKTVVKVSLVLVLLPLAVALYIRAVDRFPHFKTWIASASLILSHLQIVGLLSSLTSVESVSSGGAFAALQAALLVCIDLGTVEPQCLLEPPPEPQYKYRNVVQKDGSTAEVYYAAFDLHACLTSPAVFGVATACALPVVAFLAGTLAKLVVKWRPPRSHGAAPPPQEAADTEATEPLPAQLEHAVDAAVAACDEPPPHPSEEEDANLPTSPPPSPPELVSIFSAAGGVAAPKHAATARIDKYENWLVIVYSLQLPTVFRVALSTVVLGAYGDTHYPLYVGVPIAVLELAYMLKLLRHMRTLQGRRSCFGWRHTALPQERLLARLQYLVCRYAEHAPYWQFVLWARQLAIIVIIAGFEAYDDTSIVLAEAGATLAILGASLTLHLRVRPYAHGYQNKAEVVMSLSSMLAIIVGVILFLHRTHLTQVSIEVFGAAVAGMLLGPVVLFCVWLAVVRPADRPAAELRAALLQINADSAPALSVTPSPPVTPLDARPPRVDSDVGRSCAGIGRMSTSEFLVRDE